MSRVLKATIIENKTTSVTTHFKKVTTEKTCLLSQLLSKVTAHAAVFTWKFQFVRFAAGRRTKAGDGTDQWHDQWTAATSLPHSVTTHLRFGGIFSDSIITNFLVIMTAK